MLKFDDINEVSALHKALVEAKFSPCPINGEIAGSPIIADISNRVYDELCCLQEKKRKGTGKDFQNWRRIKTDKGYRGFRRTAVISARKDLRLKGATQAEKRAVAKCYLSPFTCTESELDEFIDEVENGSAGKSIKELFKENDFKNAALIRSLCIDEASAQLTFWLSCGKVCDIFFTGLKRFEINSDSGSGDGWTLTKFSVSSGKEESFEGTFTSVKSRKTVKITADKVEYWV